MKGEKDQCYDTFQTFQQNHPEFFQQPIIQSFLQDEKHWKLVRHAICFPTRKNMQLVDKAFQTFYSNLKALIYLSNVVYSHAVNFDKTMQKHYGREVLTLDQPLQEKEGDQGATHKDMLYQSSPDMVDKGACETMADYVEDPQLYRSIQTLTSKQQEILTYKYVRKLPNKEIADLFGNSPQNISKLHQRALQKLRNHLEKEHDSRDDNRKSIETIAT